MDRLACVSIPALPLALLRLTQPTWAKGPMAVVERDRPQAPILWVNDHALMRGIRPGQRYAAALALAPDLRARPISPSEITDCVDELSTLLERFSPHVEPSEAEPGLFWLDASGLTHLYPALEVWGGDLERALHRSGFLGTVAIGHTRFGTYALAKSTRPPKVLLFNDKAAESRATRAVPLAEIGLAPEVRDRLEQLAIRTVGAFLALPSAGIRRRFGAEAHRLHELGREARKEPLVPHKAVFPITSRRELDDPELDRERLTFLIKGELSPLLGKLAARSEALSALHIELSLDRAALVTVELRPAEPTLEALQLLGLIRLRLESLTLASGVTRIVLTTSGVRATREQLELFAEKPRRDPKAAGRALARLRAAYGKQAVVRAQLGPGHLPEARFSWEPIEALTRAAPRGAPAARPLVRRILSAPEPLPHRPPREPDGWLLRGLDHGPVVRLDGPYVLSGGWWRREIARDYHFAELKDGSIYWIYYDRRRRRWFRQGQVE